MDMCELLKNDHAEVLRLADAMVDTDCPVAAKDAYRALRDALGCHARAESVVLYDTLKQSGDDAAVDRGFEGEIELTICEELLAQMARGNAEGKAWRAKAAVVRRLLQYHIQDEQKILLPLLRDQFNDDQRAALAKRFDKRKTTLMAA